MPAECPKYDMLTEVALKDLCLSFIFCGSLSTDPSTRIHFCYTGMVGPLGMWRASRHSLRRGDCDKIATLIVHLDARHHLDVFHESHMDSVET